MENDTINDVKIILPPITKAGELTQDQGAAKNKKILIVDDDVDILLMLTIFLKENGYEVEGTLNGIETTKRTERFKPDLIIMDIFLSGTNGKDICVSLKNAEETKAIPIILISSDEQDKKEVEGTRADEFINKPFEIKFLLSRVRELLDRRVAA